MLAEFFGTFLFVSVGAGSAVAMQSVGGGGAGSSLLVAALANGLGLGVAISATMSISGGQLNPAVTVGLYVGKVISGREVIPYIAAQLAGAIIAGLLLVSGLPGSAGNAVHWGAPELSTGVSIAQGLLLEGVMTFFLVFTVYGTVVDTRSSRVGGFGVGLFVLAAVLAIGPFTGGAMNPARAAGPMIAALFLPAYWPVYWVGPLIGGLLAGAVQRYLQGKQGL